MPYHPNPIPLFGVNKGKFLPLSWWLKNIHKPRREFTSTRFYCSYATHFRTTHPRTAVLPLASSGNSPDVAWQTSGASIKSSLFAGSRRESVTPHCVQLRGGDQALAAGYRGPLQQICKFSLLRDGDPSLKTMGRCPSFTCVYI